MKDLSKATLLAKITAAPLSRRRPLRFERNQLRDLADQKGFAVSREYTRHAGWIYRINILPYPGSRERLVRSYEYCKTQNATAAERLALHLLTKPDVSWSRKKDCASA